MIYLAGGKVPSSEQPASFIHREVHHSANKLQMPVKGTWELFLCGCQPMKKIRNKCPTNESRRQLKRQAPNLGIPKCCGHCWKR